MEKEEIKKNISIDGTKNRYWIQKLKDPNENLKPKNKKQIKSFHETIVSKINGYKQQDILRKQLDLSTFIDYEYVQDLLQHSHFKCFYCQNDVLIEYDIVREMKQWSLDRKDNSIGHSKTNVVLACLECNLKRKNKNMNSFLFTKQLSIKQDFGDDGDKDGNGDKDFGKKDNFGDKDLSEKDGNGEKDNDNRKVIFKYY
jgi:hypothetical protein